MFLYFPILFLLWTPTDNPLCVMNRCTKEKIISRWQLSLGATDTIIIFSFNNAHGEWIFLAKTLMMIRHWDENKHIFTYFFLHSNYQLIAWSHDKCHIHEVLFPNLKKMLLLPSAILWIKIIRILMFSTGQQKARYGVLCETRTTMGWMIGTRAHV